MKPRPACFQIELNYEISFMMAHSKNRDGKIYHRVQIQANSTMVKLNWLHFMNNP